MFKSGFFKTYLVPGFIFQSIVIGGGYGTGRELVEFFMLESPAGGLLGMLLATLIWSMVMSISFELARLSKTYDYRSFIGSVMGKGWAIYEIVYVTRLILVISVLGSAAGNLLHDLLGIPELAGIFMMILIVGIIVFFGTSLIEKLLSVWSIALYAAFFFLVCLTLFVSGDSILNNIKVLDPDADWLAGGIRYSAYNIGLVPAMIYVARHFNTRKEAMLSGLVAGALAMIPGLFIYLAMLAAWPEILSEEVPVNFLLEVLDVPVFRLIFQVILLGTFIETGVGLIHGLNERISGVYQKNNRLMPHWLRIGVAMVVLVISIFVADTLGIVTLIANGYGFITWGFMIAFVIPVLSIGVYRIMRS